MVRIDRKKKRRPGSGRLLRLELLLLDEHTAFHREVHQVAQEPLSLQPQVYPVTEYHCLPTMLPKTVLHIFDSDLVEFVVFGLALGYKFQSYEDFEVLFVVVLPVKADERWYLSNTNLHCFLWSVTVSELFPGAFPQDEG